MVLSVIPGPKVIQQVPSLGKPAKGRLPEQFTLIDPLGKGAGHPCQWEKGLWKKGKWTIHQSRCLRWRTCHTFLFSRQELDTPSKTFFPSNARWLSPGRLTNRKDNCILQIQRIRSVATSVLSTVCNQKRTELDRYIIHCAVTVQNQESRQRKQTQNKTKPTKTKNTQDNKTQDSTAGGQLISS